MVDPGLMTFEESDTVVPVEDGQPTEQPTDPVVECRNKAMAAIEKLEQAVGCMHCPGTLHGEM